MRSRNRSCFARTEISRNVSRVSLIAFVASTVPSAASLPARFRLRAMKNCMPTTVIPK